MIIVPDLLETFIDSLTFESAVINQTYDLPSDTTTITVEDSFFARTDLVVYLDGFPYTVKSFDSKLNQLVFDTELAPITTLTLSNPFFFHGTPYMTNIELTKIQKTDSKFPMIYLYEIVREDIRNEEKDGLAEIADIRLFFLDNANFRDWDTDKHYTNSIRPQRKLVDEFILQMNKYKMFDRSDNITLINHVNFGQFVDKKGHLQSIFNEKTSGIELQIKLRIRDCNC